MRSGVKSSNVILCNIPSSQFYGTDTVYYIYLLLKFSY